MPVCGKECGSSIYGKTGHGRDGYLREADDGNSKAAGTAWVFCTVCLSLRLYSGNNSLNEKSVRGKLPGLEKRGG